MGASQSKPENPMTPEKFMKLMDQYPEYVLQYYQSNEDDIEKYIVENFWEEDVERWLTAIRKRSPKKALQVRKIDLLKTSNATAHHTDVYEGKYLVLRRANEMKMKIIFGNREFEPDRDDLNVVFNIGKKPEVATKSKIRCPVTKVQGPKCKWSCMFAKIDSEEKSVTVNVNIPVNAIIGKYSIELEMISGAKSGREKTYFKGPQVIVVFNPFSKEDTVYMENEADRNEYVFNDTGFINTGSYGRRGAGIRQKPWDFAQFDAGVLDCVVEMIYADSRMSPKALKKYNTPVYVSRVVSAMVNSNGDDGILMGNWSGDYEGGASPLSWEGSEPIYRLWMDKNWSPVKYGQCWVFSGLVTTALRTLGIPCRSVTNYESARDTEGNATVDIYIDDDTYDRKDETSDSVWSFHVWNECFFRRPDLPEGYDGWQVVDATPQEESPVADSKVIGKTLMQCGPAPLKAIKEGDVNIGNDTAFVFSEVNADKVQWFVDKEGNIIGDPIVQKKAIGKYIATKAVGSDTTVNIINLYKYPEGSPEERRAFNKAYSLGTKEIAFETERLVVDPAFELTIDGPDQSFIGDAFIAKITVKNVSEIKHQGKLNIAGKTKLHVGKIHNVQKKENHLFEIDAGKIKEFTLKIDFDDYMDSLVDNYHIHVAATASSSTDGKVALSEEDFTLEMPNCFELKPPDYVSPGDENVFDFKFTNKFPKKLTGGVFSLKARNCIAQEFRKLAANGPILPKETREFKGVKFHPKSNWRSVYCTMHLDTSQLKDISQTIRIKIF